MSPSLTIAHGRPLPLCYWQAGVLVHEDVRVSGISDTAGGFLAYYLGIAIVALPGLIGVLLIGRMHRAAMRDYRALREEMSKAELATGRVRCLLADLVATMNLSLASVQGNTGANQEQIEELRQAAEEALRGQPRTPSAPSATA